VVKLACKVNLTSIHIKSITSLPTVRSDWNQIFQIVRSDVAFCRLFLTVREKRQGFRPLLFLDVFRFLIRQDTNTANDTG